MSGQPSHFDLVRYLYEAKQWDRLGAYLGLSEDDIKEIESSYSHHGNERMRMVMLDKWLKKDINASWDKVIAALKRMGLNTLANKLERKLDTSNLLPSAKNSSHQVQLDLQVRSGNPISREIEDLISEYLMLIIMVEQAIDEVNPSNKLIKRFSQIYLLSALTVEEIFDQLKPFYLLQFATLKRIAKFFLKDCSMYLRVEQHVYSTITEAFSAYEAHLERFKRSTTVQQFLENVAAQVQHSLPDGPGMVDVCIKLHGNCLAKTMAELEILIQEGLNERLNLPHLIKFAGTGIGMYDLVVLNIRAPECIFNETHSRRTNQDRVGIAISRPDDDDDDSQYGNRNLEDARGPAAEEHQAANSSNHTGHSSSHSTSSTANDSQSTDSELILVLLHQAVWAMLVKRMIAVLVRILWAQFAHNLSMGKIP